MNQDGAANAEETPVPEDAHAGWELRELELAAKEREAPRAIPRSPPTPELGDVLRKLSVLAGVDLTDVETTTHRCAGGCAVEVSPRGAYCPSCGELWRQRARCQELHRAYASLDPEEKLAWCRRESPEYQQRVGAAITAARNLPTDQVRGRALDVFGRAAWRPTDGNLLILGETGIGKSSAMLAIGLRILDAASAGRLEGDAYKLAKGLRYASGLDLGRALSRAIAAQQRGDREDGDPPLVARAKRASLLLLDEIGYEESRFDPHAVRDVLDARYRAFATTIATSGKTIDELNERYGAATMRRLTHAGVVVDLHPSRPQPTTQHAR